MFAASRGASQPHRRHQSDGRALGSNIARQTRAFATNMVRSDKLPSRGDDTAAISGMSAKLAFSATLPKYWCRANGEGPDGPVAQCVRDGSMAWQSSTRRRAPAVADLPNQSACFPLTRRRLVASAGAFTAMVMAGKQRPAWSAGTPFTRTCAKPTCRAPGAKRFEGRDWPLDGRLGRLSRVPTARA
jgi:hypothetical protein